MSLYRRAAKVDATQSAVVDALREAGWHVYPIRWPCDLACWKPSKGWRMLEVKTPTKTGRIPKRNSQPLQEMFCALTQTPKVTTPEQAIAAVEGT